MRQVSKDKNRGITVPLYRNKGKQNKRKKYRDISLSVAPKMKYGCKDQHKTALRIINDMVNDVHVGFRKGTANRDYLLLPYSTTNCVAFMYLEITG